MKATETKVLVAELKSIAFTLTNENSQRILEEAADRLEDTEKIAEFYRMKAEKGARGWRRG